MGEKRPECLRGSCVQYIMWLFFISDDGFCEVKKKLFENQGIFSQVCLRVHERARTHTHTHTAFLSFLACYRFCGGPNFQGSTSKGVALCCSFSFITDVNSFLKATLSKLW